MIIDTYKTIENQVLGEFKDRGSKFIAYAFPVMSEEAIQGFQDQVRKDHPKARHHCYAWRLGVDQNRYRANDDGEPSGTAGRPILGQIDSFGLTNVLIIVVRYFGGTLLGTSGLINAYRESAADALRQSVILEKIIKDAYELSFDYALMSDVMNALKKLHWEITLQEFTEKGRVVVAIRKGDVPDELLRFKSLVTKKSLEEAAGMDNIPGLEINLILP